MHRRPTAIFTVPASEPWQLRWRAFHDPVAIWMCARPADMRAALQHVQEWQAAGYYVCAALSYEASPAFDGALAIRDAGLMPSAWFAAFECADEYVPTEREFALGAAEVMCEKPRYMDTVRAVLDHIRAGDIYQANFTVRALCDFHGDALGAFGALVQATRVPYACYVDTGATQVVSMSPELFFEKRGREIASEPMKGTAARRPSWDDDEAARLALMASAKDRAELTMIVDLMRNDFGRICRTGSVVTADEFRVRRYPTVLQMTTRVMGTLRDDVELFDVLRATFPPGSVTGAPKIRATEVIREREDTPRGIYCGSVMLCEPNGDITANVAIRTLEINGNTATVGIGSGIVADSDPAREWDEVLLKAKFTQLRPRDFGLYEAFRYVPQSGFQSLDQHLRRLEHSCIYFGRPFPEEKIRARLTELALTLGDTPTRVRLDLQGEEIELTLMPEELGWPNEGVVVMIPDMRLDPEDARLYHKTTLRPEKYTLRAKAKTLGAHECLFRNLRDEFTEGTISSFTFRVRGEWITPALTCGLLPGVWRSGQIESGDTREGVVREQELHVIDAIRIGNSVRGVSTVVKIIREDGTVVYDMTKART